MIEDQHTFRATVTRIPVGDVTEALEFYVGKLGFKPLYRFEAEAGVGLGEVILRFYEDDTARGDGVSIYFEISNTDALFEKYAAEGVNVRFAPRDQPWGSRDFGIRDPNGYALVFGDFRNDTGLPRSPRMAEAIRTMMAGDLSRLRCLLEANPQLVSERAPVKYRPGRQGTLLHFLMDYPDSRHPANIQEIAKFLIDSGADVGALDGYSEGSTSLDLLMSQNAPVQRAVELTRLLLDAGASATRPNADHGMDAFTLALLHGQTDCASVIFERGYPVNFSWVGAGLGKMDLVRGFFGEDDGESGLPDDQRAVHFGDSAQNAMNCAFLVAAINGQEGVIEYLLDKGMDVNMQPPGSDFAGIGGTALHWAARYGHLQAVQLLVGRGGDPRAQDDVFKLTPAGWAGWYGHIEIKRFLQTR